MNIHLNYVKKPLKEFKKQNKKCFWGGGYLCKYFIDLNIK